MNMQELTETLTKKIRSRYQVRESEPVRVSFISITPEQKSTKVWAQFTLAPLDIHTGRKPQISGVVSALIPPNAAPAMIFYRTD